MTTKSKTPQIRFKGSSEEWNQHKLGELLVITSASRVHKNEWTESGVPFFRSSDVVADYKGLQNNKAFISFDLYKELSNKSGRVQKNDLLVTGGGSIGIPYLVKNNEPLYFKDADLLWLKNSDNINGFFLYTFFSTLIFRSYVGSISHIGTISHYTVEQAKLTPINIPVKKEQDKIGDYFQYLDKLIEQKEKKYQKFRQFKKAMLDKMFPKNGATTPEIRFIGFSGEWEEKKLGDIANITIGEFVIKTRQNPNSLYPVYNGGKSYTGFYDEFNNEGSKIIISARGANAGFVNFEKRRYWAGNSCYSIDFIDKNLYCIEFFYHYIKKNQNRFTDNQQAANIPSVSKSDAEKFNVNFPQLDEQNKIANYFQKLDNLINLHKAELIKLKNIKKASLEKMFV